MNEHINHVKKNCMTVNFDGNFKKEDDLSTAGNSVCAAENELRDLEDLLGQTIEVTAFFVRYGLVSAESGNDENVTLLLKNPYTFHNGHFRRIASHCWIRYNNILKQCNLHHGDKVVITAVVERYEKRSGQYNYTLSNTASARVIERNPTPAKLGIFNISVPLIRCQQGYVALKGGSKTLYQKKLVVRGQVFSPSDINPPRFDFKLRDITCNGTFRFFYKLPGQNKWFRYAYFFPNKGQKIFFISGNHVSRIYIDAETYFVLKDAYAQFAYSGEFKFPLKPYVIENLAKKDKNPNLVEGRWPSKRVLVSTC